MSPAPRRAPRADAERAEPGAQVSDAERAETAEPEPGAVTVYRFGAPTRGGARRLVLPDLVVEQLRLAHELSNRLVELSLTRDTAVTEVWSSYPNVAAAEAQVAEANERAEAAAAKVSAARIAQRTRTPETPYLAELKAARADTKAARLDRKEAIAAIKTDAQARLREIDKAHRGEIKATYADFVQTRGLYWATWNDVVDHARQADQRVMAARKQGKPARRRFRRWDGSGCIAVQLQRSAEKPPRTPELLSSGEGPWRNVLQVNPWVPPGEWAELTRAEQRSTGHGTVTLTIGAGRTFRLPVQVHRMLPAEADVTGARVVVERIAGQTAISVHVTAKIPPPVPRTGGATLALHLGWRRDADDDTLRVATWRTDAPVTVPEHLRDIVDQRTSTTGTVRLPDAWREQINRPDRVRADRDVLLNGIRDQLVAYLSAHPLPDQDEGDERALTAGRVKAWRSPGRFAALAMAWRENPPSGGNGAGIAADLEAWRRHDKRLWEAEAHGRRKAIGRRDDAYRRFAAWVAQTVTTVAVDSTSLPGLSRKGSLTAAPDMPSAVEARASSQRVDAAPGYLRAAVVAAATREGVAVTEVSHVGIGRTHPGCGHVHEPGDPRFAATAVVVCDGCGAAYDQDLAATQTVLALAS